MPAHHHQLDQILYWCLQRSLAFRTRSSPFRGNRTSNCEWGKLVVRWAVRPKRSGPSEAHLIQCGDSSRGIACGLISIGSRPRPATRSAGNGSWGYRRRCRPGDWRSRDWHILLAETESGGVAHLRWRDIYLASD